MVIECDPAKDAANQKKHGVSLVLAADFDWDAVRVQPARTEGTEVRFRVQGKVRGVLYSAIVTDRGGSKRVISLRRANRKERDAYAAEVWRS